MRCSWWGWIFAVSAASMVMAPSPAVGEMAGADSLRGTTAPIERSSNLLQKGGRAIALPIYGAWRALSWPLEQGVLLYDRSERLQDAVALLAGGKKVGPFRLSPFANFESGEGFSELGLLAKADDWPHPEWRVRSKTGFLDRERNIVDVEFSTPESRRACLHLRSHFESKTNRRFHGIGPSSPSRKLLYDSRGFLVESWVDFLIFEHLVLDVAGWYTRHDLDDIADRVDEPGESVATQLPTDFDLAEEIEYSGVALRLIDDRREGGAFAHRGRAFVGELGFDRSLRSGKSDYVHYRAQLQWFVPLSSHRVRTLALRAFAAGIDPSDGALVPFTEMERPGGRQGFRGYPRNRFADLKQFVLTAEYRYRLTHRMQAALFTDWGSVASGWQDMTMDAVDPSYGFSLILGRERPASFQVAFSSEGVQFSFGSETLFSLRSRRLR